MRQTQAGMKKFTEQFEKYRSHFERILHDRCENLQFFPDVLADSMRYSLLCGGKRIRPVLFYAALDMFGGDYAKEDALAFAIECIHTYSLIHDDLPAMDNDDMRRGKPSNHKVFGEANAILAGDALLSLAYDLMLKECGRGEQHRSAALILSEAAGPDGMIAGQSADCLYEHAAAGREELEFIYRNKTGRLIAAPLAMAAVLTKNAPAPDAASQFGLLLGKLFQMTDDILDETGESASLGKTVGKDRKEGKLTCVKVLGLEGALAEADRCAEQCRAALNRLGTDRFFFDELVTMIRNRDR